MASFPRASSNAELSFSILSQYGVGSLATFLLLNEVILWHGVRALAGVRRFTNSSLASDVSVLAPVPSPDRSGDLSAGQVEPEMQGFLTLFSPEVLQTGQRARVVFLKVFLEWRTTGAIFGIFSVLLLSHPMCCSCMQAISGEGAFPSLIVFTITAGKRLTVQDTY